MSVHVIQGDVRVELPKLKADYFDCIVTSPPYYGLRDYGTATWEGGDPECDHIVRTASDRAKSNGLGVIPGYRDKLPQDNSVFKGLETQFRSECGKCGARRIDAQIGLEPTLDAYLETMVAVCRELRRVLKPSGVFFLNCGDSYAGSGKGGNPPESKHKKQATNAGSLTIGDIVWKPGPPYKGPIDTTPREFGIKQKDLMLVPERLGIALQADGWWVRSRIVWSKPNPMPESCTDRPTNAHETIWMLTKSANYFWDGEAVREYASTFKRQKSFGKSPKIIALEEDGTHGKGGKLGVCYDYQTRNMRNVWSDLWTIATHPFPGAHFATFPPALVERCIKAGCPISGHTLDPFAGSGTVGLVADRLGRNATLIDLNTSYIDMSVNRIRDDAPLFAEVAAE